MSDSWLKLEWRPQKPHGENVSNSSLQLFVGLTKEECEMAKLYRNKTIQFWFIQEIMFIEHTEDGVRVNWG